MNINKENTDELNAVVTIELGKEDYEEKVTDVLKDYKRKARIDGFRPGKVPFGLINKMYRKPVLIDEINKLVSQKLYDFIRSEDINILGDPLPHNDESPDFDWDNDTEFKFQFDLALAPELDIQVTAKDKFPFYLIKVDDDMVNKYIDQYCQQFGKMVEQDATDEKSVIRANIRQFGADGKIAENGISVDDASMSIEIIKDEAIKTSMAGRKVDETLTIDLKKAYPNDTELSQLLQIEKDAVANIDSEFEITITSINVFKKADINQELFDKAFGEGEVQSEEDFRKKIVESAEKGLLNDSEFRFKIDVKEQLTRKFKKDLPAEFLKRWILRVNEGKFTEEEIEKDFDKFGEDLKWQLIKDKIAKEQDIKVAEEEIQQAAIQHARRMFMQYGMGNVPDESLAGFADNILKKDEEKKRIVEGLYEDKVLDYIKSIAKIDEKSITMDKFNKLFEDKEKEKK